MRITESRLLQVTTRGVDVAKQRVGDAGQQLSSGFRVSRPSDDPTAWIDGMRSRIRRELSESQGLSMARARDRLGEAEMRVREVMDLLSQATERAVMFSNETHTAEARRLGAEEISVIRDRILATLNSQGTDGEYIFAGSRSDRSPFDPTGSYLSDNANRGVETPDGGVVPMTVSGQEFTSQYGIDVLGTVDDFLDALRRNDVVTVQRSVTALQSGFEQTNAIMRRIGARHASLDSAEEARLDLDVQLETVFAQRMATDPVQAAIQLREGESALEGARAAIQSIVQMTRIN